MSAIPLGKTKTNPFCSHIESPPALNNSDILFVHKYPQNTSILEAKVSAAYFKEDHISTYKHIYIIVRSQVNTPSTNIIFESASIQIRDLNKPTQSSGRSHPVYIEKHHTRKNLVNNPAPEHNTITSSSADLLIRHI